MTLPKEKGGVPPIEIHTILRKEDSESAKKFHEEQLEKVRNLKAKPQPPKPKFTAPKQSYNTIRRSGRGR